MDLQGRRPSRRFVAMNWRRGRHDQWLAIYDDGRVGGPKMSERAEFFIKGRELLKEPYNYVASGLPNVFLLNGVSETNTPYGPMVTIEDINGLHHAIGLYIIENPEQMTGAEFRFLRKQLELTQAQLGDYLRVSDQTVANYEKGNTSLGPVDPQMRMLYLISVLPEQTRLEVLKDMTAKISSRERAELPQVSRRQIAQCWQERHLQAA
jgi:DNA-binding transcriptional regulator YiaG